MNPINNLVGSPSLATAGLVSGGANAMIMAHNPTSFDTNMASSVTLACCQSLCDVLTELPLPTAVVDKSAHTRSLVTGLNVNIASRNSLLSDTTIVPHLQQALFMAKQQLNEISFITSSCNQLQPQSTVSPSNSDAHSQPSPLLLELSSRGCFSDSHSSSSSSSTPSTSSSLIYRQQTNNAHSHPLPPINNNNNTQVSNSSCSNNIIDMNVVDLHTIEPSIDKHMTDLHQNLMNDLINDDCDMSSSISNTNNNGTNGLGTNYSLQNHSVQSMSSMSSVEMVTNDYSHHNHDYRMTRSADTQIKAEQPDNYSSLGERVKSRQREAAQKAIQANSVSFSVNSSQNMNLPQAPTISANEVNLNSFNSNITSSVNNNKIKHGSSDSSDDKDWKLSSVNKKTKNDTPSSSSSFKKNISLPTTVTSFKNRRAVIEVAKPQIRSVKYSFSDSDYSDSMLLNSTVDIVLRFEQIIDEILSISCNDFNEYGEEASDDEYYEMEQKRSAKKKIKSFDWNHPNGMAFNVSIESDQLKEIMILSAKLKQNNRVVEVERKKLILFLTVLSNQLNIWFARYKSKACLQNQDEENYEDTEERHHYWELCCNASQSALHIMTSSSPNNDKASLISLEELIEVIVDFISNNLSSATHVSKSSSKSSKSKNVYNQHFGVSKRHVTRWTQLLQLLFEFINLRTKGSLTDTLILSLTRISMSALFLLQNTAEMQYVSIEILCHVFEEYQKHRMSILEELLNSLSKIPTKKSHRKDSVLTQILTRLINAFFQPEINANASHNRDSLNRQSQAALKVITGFLSHFLRKCHQHTSNSDVDFRLIFEALLNDLLDSFNSPHSTASIMIVQVIIKLLISYLSVSQTSKSQSSSLAARLLAIEYLSIICSKFAQFLAEKDDVLKELEKTFSAIEEVEKSTKKTKQTNNNNTETQFVNKICYLLLNYFDYEKLPREKLVLASIWIKDKYYSENEQREIQFLQKLNSSKMVDDNTSVIDISTACLCIQYMEFVHFTTNSRLFDHSIFHVTASLSNTTNTTQRSRAMKCLSNILSSSTIDRATMLLSRNDLQSAMRSALLDPSTSVREATVDLIGRFVLQSKDQNLCQRYCDLIGDRILDTGISVRKRVIKILRDFCIEFPEFDKCGEMAVKIVRRINDDGEGIRRLVVDTCRDLWFTTSNSAPIKYKVYSLLHVIANMINDNASMESMQSLFDQLIKADTMSISQQICDSIMSDVLIDDMPQSTKVTQLSAVQCVSMMSQCCPLLMVKHIDTLQSLMSLPCETIIEISLRMKVIQTIERILPHIQNPSPNLMTRIEEDLTKNILQSSATIIQSSIKCLCILIKNHTKNTKLAVDLFCKIQQILYQYRNLLYEGNSNDQQVKPKLLRALFTCGLFAKYFSSHISEYKDRVRDTFIELIESPYDVDIKCKSIVALGFIVESDPKICLLPKVINIYTRILKNEYSSETEYRLNKKNDESFCIQVLNNFRNYLSGSIESDENAVKTIEWSRESLKLMHSLEDDSSSAQSQIIQQYLSSILINALNPNLAIRRVACNVIHVIHSGGHVHPLQLVPHLVAMTCDDDYQIRARADHVLHDIERKYHGYVAMKAKEAVNLSALFCKKLSCSGYRIFLEKSTASASDGQNLISIPSTNKEICARLSTLYHVICTNRQSRRGFIASFLRHFDMSELMVKNVKTDGQQFSTASNTTIQKEIIDLEFIAENILFFPYTVYDEILYILNQLECTSSINATYITQLFKEVFIVEKSVFEPNQQIKQFHQPLPPVVEHSQTNPAFMDPSYSGQIYDHNNMFPVNRINDLNFLGNSKVSDSAVFYNQFNQTNSTQENVDIEDIDLENEEHAKKYENNIHVNFDLLLSDTQNERLSNLVRSLRAIYLSTLLRTLLKEFYLLKDEKINDYSTNDAKTWEKPVHRRQIESAYLKEHFNVVKPQINCDENLLMNHDLQMVEKQLLDEWKRFKQVSLNNFDPNFKPQSLTKMFSTKSNSINSVDLEQKKVLLDEVVDTSSTKIVSDQTQQHSKTKPLNEISSDSALNQENKNLSSRLTKINNKKSKLKKKRKRVVLDDESEETSDDQNDDDYYV